MNSKSEIQKALMYITRGQTSELEEWSKTNDVNAKNDVHTLLTFACFLNCYYAALTLIKNGANVNSQDIEGNTPLDYAVMNENCLLIGALFLKGAKCNKIDPVHYFSDKNKMNNNIELKVLIKE